MRKFILLAAAVFFGIGAQAASYGILVNNSKYFEAAALGDKDHQGRDQYKASVSLNAGDVFCVYDKDNNAKFTIAMEAGEGSAKDKFTEGAESATCNEAGCYDFYIKLKWEDNSMWVQAGTECSATGEDITPGEGGGSGEGGEGGGSGSGAKDYFLKGWCNGKDIETPTADELFEHGILQYTFTGDDVKHQGYFFILICEAGQVIGEQYMCASYTEGVTHAQMVKTGGEKFGVPEGTVTFYLYDNEDGSYELSTEKLAGKKLVDEEGGEGGGGEEQAIENVYEINLSAPMFDLLGRKVTEEYHGVVIQNGHKFIR